MRFLAGTAAFFGALLVLSVHASPGAQVASTAGVVSRVIDGDTIALRDGQRVRLVQIDSPEVGSGECYSRAAARALRVIVPVGTTVSLDVDPNLDATDKYGRLLRYVVRGKVNANLEMVRRGAAAPWFYEGARGRYASQFMRLATAARGAKLGLWGACPGTALDPTRAVDTDSSGSPSATPLPLVPPPPPSSGGGSNCDPSYVGVCIPSPPPDLDCGEIPYKHFTVRHDVPDPDPHGFDGDRDGVGCET